MILTSLDDVRPGMVLGVGLRNREGLTLLGPGVTLTGEYVQRLRDLGYWAVWIDDEDTRDIRREDILSESTRAAATAAIQETFALTSERAMALRSASSGEIRDALKTRQFQPLFQDHPAIERLMEQVDVVVGEVLNHQVLTGLGAIRTHDTYTFHHCLDVSVTATLLGRLLGYGQETLKKLAVGCILHDIGKIFVNDAILNSSGDLSPEELQRVKDHTVLGYLFLRDNLRLGVLPPHIAYQHHERQDGAGYPRGLTGTNRIVQGLEIHIPGRITPLGEIAAIADFHDAVSSDRPYRRGLPPDRVWQLIRERAGTHFNREMVALLLEVLPPYPLGSRVVATEGPWRGYRGVVAKVPREAMDRPTVRLLADPTGRRVEAFEVNLMKDEGRIRGVTRQNGDGPSPCPSPYSMPLTSSPLPSGERQGEGTRA